MSHPIAQTESVAPSELADVLEADDAPNAPPSPEPPMRVAPQDGAQPRTSIDTLDGKPMTSLVVDVSPGAMDDEGRLIVPPTSHAAPLFESLERRPIDTARSVDLCYQWDATSTCHRPLLFEDVAAERSGFHYTAIQPFISAAHFWGSIPLVPYRLVVNPPYECIYTLGHNRPGDCVPYQWEKLPVSLHAPTFEERRQQRLESGCWKGLLLDD